MVNIELITGDITTMKADAIVCPAHKHLIPGRGLSEQIHAQAGSQLNDECQLFSQCKVGDAVVTHAYNLPADYIIHTVTPQWSSGDVGGTSDLQLLSRCYQSVIEQALKSGFQSLIFPALGAGTNRFPQTLASHQALDVLEKNKHLFEHIVVCLHSEASKNIWQQTQQTFYH
ncbi:MAG: macro domain-containing protein [Pseudomonadales bacterium]|nr:macro domain-containing protein [Pseudomonadales bacterium]